MTIDVHCHLFTAQDIPVCGFLRARGVPDRMARRIDQAIRQMSPEDGMGMDCAVGNEREKFLRMIEPKHSSSVIPANYGAWIRILTLPSQQLADRMLASYPDTRLFVPLMVDLEYWIEGQVKRPFAEQLQSFSAIIERHPGRIHPFVAFSPERARRCLVDLDRAFSLFSDALFERGFIGVKLYPPVGFRPGENVQQRQAPPHAKAYDEWLTGLYRLCEKYEIPITAHCTNRGVKAGHGKGRLAHPGSWQRVLERFPGLHLNLAHFGGERHLSRLGRRSWSWAIARLMDQFDHVYTDTAYHKRICRERSREKLFDGLERICEHTPKVLDRIMFGTDWHILATRRNSRVYADIYREQYRERFGEAATRALFSGNAQKFLGLTPGGKNRQRLRRFYADRKWNRPDWLPAGNDWDAPSSPEPPAPAPPDLPVPESPPAQRP